MSVREPRSGGIPAEHPGDADEDERRRLSVFDLLGLAAGGVVGSCWVRSASRAAGIAGFDAVWAWAIGGALMLVIAIVMVELGTAAPKTGGLVFLPLQSSGALVATVVAAGLWTLYAINPASEAAAMTDGLSAWVPGLFDPSGNALTVEGFLWSTLFMAVMVAVNLLAPRLFAKVNFLLTVWKVLVPVLIVVLLLAAGFDTRWVTAQRPGVGHGLEAALAAVVGSGVIYAYLGFQGPLDFAGNIRRRGVGEGARLRWSVYGTILGSIVLYLSLQVVFLGHLNPAQKAPQTSPYTQFAVAASLLWVTPFIRLDTLLSPLGAGLVYTHVLTGEVAALSRAHLTHRGLQVARNASLRLGGRLVDVYWMVLLVDFAIGWVALLLVGGSWGTLITASSVLTLIVYAVPGVTLVALRRHLPRVSGRRTTVRRVLALLSFLLTGQVLYWAGWSALWPGLAALAAGCLLLLGLPMLARRHLPLVGGWFRRYDAKEHVTRFRDWRTPSSGAAPAIWLLGYLAVLSLLTLAANSRIGFREHWVGSVLGVAASGLAFHRLVVLSEDYADRVRPSLPTPTPALPRPRAAGEDPDRISAASG
ncbi:APC family permease [Kitasatospora viridis]|uniref:APC family permease n=1 Tax=Kitasatospora viridis TaxID=281105 RepID=UPI0031D1DC53